MRDLQSAKYNVSFLECGPILHVTSSEGAGLTKSKPAQGKVDWGGSGKGASRSRDPQGLVTEKY